MYNKYQNVMKKLIVILFTAFIAFGAFAQGNNVKCFEFEVGVGTQLFWENAIIGASQLQSDKANSVLFLVLESRVNLTGTPFDVGFQFSIGGFDREWINLGSLYYNMTSTVTYFDYNFRKWKNVHLFGGGYKKQHVLKM